jgi:hypothetical protein
VELTFEGGFAPLLGRPLGGVQPVRSFEQLAMPPDGPDEMPCGSLAGGHFERESGGSRCTPTGSPASSSRLRAAWVFAWCGLSQPSSCGRSIAQRRAPAGAAVSGAGAPVARCPAVCGRGHATLSVQEDCTALLLPAPFKTGRFRGVYALQPDERACSCGREFGSKVPRQLCASSAFSLKTQWVEDSRSRSSVRGWGVGSVGNGLDMP